MLLSSDPRYTRRVPVVLVVLCWLAAGCGGTTTYWRNNSPGANWNTDLYQCTAAHSITITEGSGTGLAGAINTAQVGSVRTDYAMRDLCLRSRSWYQVSEPSSAVGAATPATSAARPKGACPWGQYWDSGA